MVALEGPHTQELAEHLGNLGCSDEVSSHAKNWVASVCVVAILGVEERLSHVLRHCDGPTNLMDGKSALSGTKPEGERRIEGFLSPA